MWDLSSIHHQKIFFLRSIDMAIRRKWKPLLFLAGPVAVHLVLSGLKLYPFTERFLLYAMPLFILIGSFGTVRLFQIVKARILITPEIILFFPVLVIALPLLSRFPVEREELKKSLKYMNTWRKE